MKHLISLIEQRKEIGQTKSPMCGGNYNNIIEYRRIGDLIIEEVCRLYDTGKIKQVKEKVDE